MRCIYCDEIIQKYTLYSLLIDQDLLCTNCRNSLRLNKTVIKVGENEVESFYEYEKMFKSLLIQYKECFDEALADVFLYKLIDYIELKYAGYNIIYIPSSKQKLNKRGFNHLSLIFNKVKLNKADGLYMKQELIQEGKNILSRKAMADNYYYKGQCLQSVLVVDDVITTGSSFLGAFKALKPYCRRIKGLSLAYVRK